MEMELSFREFGDESKPSLLVFHGLLGSSRNWKAAGSSLGRYFHVFCLDLRNHGKSPHASPHSYQAMLDDALEWMDRRNLKSSFIMGHSMGGKLAMKLACNRPDRVSKLVIVDIAPKTYSRAHDSDYTAMRSLDLEGLASRSEADRLLEPWVPDWAKRQFLLTNLATREGGKGYRWIVNLDAIEAGQREIEGSPVSEGDRFEGETLLVLGRKSSYVEASDLPLFQRLFPMLRVHFMENSGHNPHFDEREAFVSVVAEFLGVNEAG